MRAVAAAWGVVRVAVMAAHLLAVGGALDNLVEELAAADKLKDEVVVRRVLEGVSHLHCTGKQVRREECKVGLRECAMV